MEDKTALRCWTVARPEISRLVDEFYDISGNLQTRQNKSHHDETFSFQKHLFETVIKMKATLSE